jgi:hypothetical protein
MTLVAEQAHWSDLFAEATDLMMRERSALTRELVELRAAVDWNVEQRGIQAREIERLRAGWDECQTYMALSLEREERLRAALDVEHEIQRQMIERLGIEWTPGEPFYSLIEQEITRWRTGW